MPYERTLFLPPNVPMSGEKLASLVSDTYGADKKARIRVDGNGVEVTWGDWSLRVYYECGPDVRSESVEMASGYAGRRPDLAWLAACDRWITIASDKDYEMNHFNHFLFLLGDLEREFPGSVLYVNEEGTFFEAGDFN